MVVACDVRRVRYLRVKYLGKKGYVALVTNLGNLNIEVWSRSSVYPLPFLCVPMDWRWRCCPFVAFGTVLQLHCDNAPKTCENFLRLCESGYYNNVIFHRSIRNFMVRECHRGSSMTTCTAAVLTVRCCIAADSRRRPDRHRYWRRVLLGQAL